MPITDYIVKRDYFEDSDDQHFNFPCCCCVHRTKDDNQDPCRVCDHNTITDLE